MTRRALLSCAAVLLLAGPAAAQNPLPAIHAAKKAAAAVHTAQTTGNQPGGKEALEQSTAQTEPAAPAPAATAPANPTAPAGPTAAAGYSYDPGGRRDPFVSLLARGQGIPTAADRPAGLAGLLIGDMTVKGIMKDPGGFLGIVQAADNKTYIVHAGDRVLDGTVKSITQEAIVFSQDVNDPLSLVKQREVRKTIRPEVK
ncbi:MAG TPA: hypothetical protein VFX12_01250 [Vicinamibacterales bacterium]|nr:hypothetical protein [Vicinamibacterales bacterium]